MSPLRQALEGRWLRAARAAGLSLACALFAQAASAQDVWGYVDANGVAHFANERVDERYQLFFRAGQSFDTSAGVPRGGLSGPAIDTPRKVAVPTSSQNRLLAFFDVSSEFKAIRPLMREAASQHGIDFELVQAVIAAESGYNRQAVSPKGAIGLMQIMPATGERYGVTSDRAIAHNGKSVKGARSTSDKLFDPRTNLGVGTRYLRDLMRMFPGRLDLVLAAYNAGEGAVQRSGNQIPPYRETQNYVQTVLALYQALKPPVAVNQAPPQRVRMEIGGAIRACQHAALAGLAGRLQPAKPAGRGALTRWSVSKRDCSVQKMSGLPDRSPIKIPISP